MESSEAALRMDDVRVRCEEDAEEEEPPRGRAGAGSVALGADLPFFFSPAVEAALPMLNTATVAGDDQWRRGIKFGDWEDVRVSRSHVSCGGPARGQIYIPRRCPARLKILGRRWNSFRGSGSSFPLPADRSTSCRSSKEQWRTPHIMTSLIVLSSLARCVNLEALTSRRAVLAAAPAVLSCASSSRAADASPTVVAVGTVLQKPDAAVPSGAALYVTARPASSEGALQAGAKTPPIASARFATPLLFPFEFVLTTDDLTAEYRAADAASFNRLDLVISARLDGDGVAATRGPDDLVGRGTLSKRGSGRAEEWRPALVELQGRGLGGRLLTGG